MYLLENSIAYVKNRNRVIYCDILCLNLEAGALFKAEQDECEPEAPMGKKTSASQNKRWGGWASPLATEIQYLGLQEWHRATLLITHHQCLEDTVAVQVFCTFTHSYTAEDAMALLLWTCILGQVTPAGYKVLSFLIELEILDSSMWLSVGVSVPVYKACCWQMQ